MGTSGWWREIGWRHAVGVVAVAFAVSPVLSIVSAAFNLLGTVVSTNLVPTSFSLVNFESLFTDPTRPFARWFANTLIVCVAVVGVQILFSALAAYAFSRFRFRGRPSRSASTGSSTPTGPTTSVSSRPAPCSPRSRWCCCSSICSATSSVESLGCGQGLTGRNLLRWHPEKCSVRCLKNATSCPGAASRQT